MPKTTEKKFTCNVNYQFDITLEDLRDLFCTMGQGVNYWAIDVMIGNILLEEDDEGVTYVKSGQDYEHEGCCMWLKELTLDSPITVEDIEEDTHEFKVKDVIKAIENIVSGKTNLNTEDSATIFEAFRDDNLGLIDASIADSILQITTYNTLVYG
jgi:hypothetical protein|tara:strand:- start:27 stop:491 length:465 start_codon:yes stop_codon:yes gene_type:complete